LKRSKGKWTYGRKATRKMGWKDENGLMTKVLKEIACHCNNMQALQHYKVKAGQRERLKVGNVCKVRKEKGKKAEQII